MTGVFPQALKIAKVVPIFKKGDRTKVNNYRPISILPVFSKIIEKIMKNQITVYFERNFLFSEVQFGFRNNKSSQAAIEKLVTAIMNGFEDHKSTYAIMCDLSKAFDCVSHETIISKLNYYGIKGKELNLF